MVPSIIPITVLNNASFGLPKGRKFAKLLVSFTMTLGVKVPASPVLPALFATEHTTGFTAHVNLGSAKCSVAKPQHFTELPIKAHGWCVETQLRKTPVTDGDVALEVITKPCLIFRLLPFPIISLL